MRAHILLTIMLFAGRALPQSFPLKESFDTIAVPGLPSGWVTSTAHSATGDFTSSVSVPHSPPNTLLSTNAALAQELCSPPVRFSGYLADSIMFYERRSGTHNSDVVLEASTDGGMTYAHVIGDTLRNPGSTAYILRRFSLPPVLNDQTDTRFRWRVLGNGTGTTGTLRIDDIIVTARALFDLALTEIRFIPALPAAGDTVEVRATVRNCGLRTAGKFGVSISLDANGNERPDPEEVFFTTSIKEPLAAGATTFITAPCSQLSSGHSIIMAQVSSSEDEEHANDLLIRPLLVGQARHSMVINEIMYAPAAGEPEWLEVFNPGASPVNALDWTVSNRNSDSRYPLSASPAEVPARGYVVVMKDTAGFRAAHPAAGSTLLQSPTLPTFLFNNNGDAAVLADPIGSVVDSIRYLPPRGMIAGTSLERIEPLGSSTDTGNWGPSPDPGRSTPGRQNYLTPLEQDLRAVALYCTGEIALMVRNVGRKAVDAFSVEFSRDENGDSAAQPSEMIGTASVEGPLRPAESILVRLSRPLSEYGRQYLMATVSYDDDMRPADNQIGMTVVMPFPPQTMVINEIMYEPVAGQSEYVELFNPTERAVDVGGWRISDVRDTSHTSNKHVMSTASRMVPSRGYLVIATDSALLTRFPELRASAASLVVRPSLFTLNNGGDNIVVSDETGNAVDSIHYLPSWHNAEVEHPSGRSLERINPWLGSNDRRNWSTCASPRGGTPGERNSLYTPSLSPSAAMAWSPNPFSPDGDGLEDVSLLGYTLSVQVAVIRVRIYDAGGRLVRTLADGEPSGAQGSLVWNGLTDRGERARMGIYIVLMEALGAEGERLETLKNVVVVAARM
jgi:hypothetical protein